MTRCSILLGPALWISLAWSERWVVPVRSSNRRLIAKPFTASLTRPNAAAPSPEIARPSKNRQTSSDDKVGPGGHWWPRKGQTSPDDELEFGAPATDSVQSKKKREAGKKKRAWANLPAPLLLKETENLKILNLEEGAALAALVQKRKKVVAAMRKFKESLGRAPTTEEVAIEVLGPSGTASELQQLLKQAKAAKMVLIRSHFPLVVRCARQIAQRDPKTLLPRMDDLVQEGIFGFLEAVDRYDPKKGAKVSTYAIWWIRNFQLLYVNEQKDLINLPETVREKTRKRRQATTILFQKLGREPTNEEIEEYTGFNAAQIDKAEKATARSQVVSYDELALRPTGETLVDHSDQQDQPGDMLQKSEIQLALEDILSSYEMEAVSLRFGLQDGRQRTLKEVGSHFGVSGERARQVVTRALDKIRSSPRAADLAEYLAPYASNPLEATQIKDGT